MAIGNRTRLEKLYMWPVYFSNNILEMMDNTNVFLEDIAVYVCEEDVDKKQLTDLKNPKQAKSLKS
jgi:hypothetical protein